MGRILSRAFGIVSAPQSRLRPIGGVQIDLLRDSRASRLNIGRRRALITLNFPVRKAQPIFSRSAAASSLCSVGKRERPMVYRFDFFRRTRDAPEGRIVRRHTDDFADLQAARAYGISELQFEDAAAPIDGCRIYCDGAYKATISPHSEPGEVPRP